MGEAEPIGKPEVARQPSQTASESKPQMNGILREGSAAKPQSLNLLARKRVRRVFGGVREMWKIVLVLFMTALAILLARLAYDAPMVQTRVGQLIGNAAPAPLAPPLMYAGVRG
jgi:hypothetical protein